MHMKLLLGLLSTMTITACATNSGQLDPGETDDTSVAGKADGVTTLPVDGYDLSPNFQSYSSMNLDAGQTVTLTGDSAPDDNGHFRLTKAGSDKFIRVYSDPAGTDLLAKFRYTLTADGATLTDVADSRTYTARSSTAHLGQACGGFVAHPKHCARGLTCKSNGNPDATGVCVK